MQHPHDILGIHPFSEKKKIIRLLRPGAGEVKIILRGKEVFLSRSEGDIFTLEVDSFCQREDYLVCYPNGRIAKDPYTFYPTFGEIDSYLFAKGVHYRLFEVLGGRVCEHEGVKGVKFSVWAPAAVSVFLVGDFNGWDQDMLPMRLVGSTGVYELFVPGVEAGERYKFSIQTKEGWRIEKADPMALYSEVRPGNASIVFPLGAHTWNDEAWMKKREVSDPKQQLNIYEVHLGSWRRREGGFLSYKELAHTLGEYVEEMGFTHVELMPITEHPLDESWGYQVSGFFAPTSRYGSPSDFQYFVDHLHQKGIGVILDWVPAHFPRDGFSLAYFDGTALYEHEHPYQGYHPHWHTHIFNYGRHEVSNFLLASALFWIEKMHIDGLRFDAVASMLYLDYGRNEGEWIPNKEGGKENLEAIEFLKHLNGILQEKYPKILTIAEESTAFPGITRPVTLGGLGFSIKWNMGWMHDSLSYFQTDPFYRSYAHQCLTFGLLYTYSERFLLPLSHDEVVHGKKSLLSKMPGDEWQKFANLRLLYAYMMTYPGKKLLFMGGEIGQYKEWNCSISLDWHLLEQKKHQQLQTFVKELNHLYKQNPALFADDFTQEGFSWVDFSDEKNSVVSYLRRGNQQELLCVHNFTPTSFDSYKIPFSTNKRLTPIFCSDEEKYGGSGRGALLVCTENEMILSLPPLGSMILKVE